MMKPFSLGFLRPRTIPRLCAASWLAVFLPYSGHAAGLQAEDGQFQDQFGWSVALEGNVGLVGAIWEDGASSSGTAERGAAYLFRNLNTASGTITENIKLIANDAGNRDELGTSVALAGNTALVGAAYDTVSKSKQGSAYLYRDLDTATGTIAQTAKLIASDPVADANFGTAISMSGTMALIGASGANVGDNENQGAVYLYRDLDLITDPVVHETAKLVASDGEYYNRFGAYVTLSGNMGIVNAFNTSAGGSAYLYRNLDTTTDTTITESAKFQNSNNEGFGGPVSIDGTNAILAGGFNSSNTYLYRNLDTAEGPLEEAAILSFSEAADYGPVSVSLSGNNALIGDSFQNRASVDMGMAYLFVGLVTASGTRIEDVKITATHSEGNSQFGISVALNGDGFIIGAVGDDGAAVYSGKAYYGTVSSLTTLDVGNTSRDVSEISFSSRQDWIVGKTTSGNTVTLGTGDSAEILATGKAIYIGQDTGANANLLAIYGNLVANEVYIGSISGNTGNTLRLEESATFTLSSIYLAAGNILSLEGDYTDINALLLYLGETNLTLWNGEFWETVDTENYAQLIHWSYSSNYTSIAAIPEPTTGILLIFGAIGLLRFAFSHSSNRNGTPTQNSDL